MMPGDSDASVGMVFVEVVSTTVWQNRRRAEAFARAEYYAWSARKASVAGRDPLTGRDWQRHDPVARGAERASCAALARYWFGVARSYPSPLPPGG